MAGNLPRFGLRLATTLFGLFYLMAGGTKLAGLPPHPEHFAQWGYPDWFRLFVGGWEALFGVLLMVPATSFYGAVGLALAMTGAAFTELTRGTPVRAVFPLVLLLVLAALAYTRRPSAARERARR